MPTKDQNTHIVTRFISRLPKTTKSVPVSTTVSSSTQLTHVTDGGPNRVTIPKVLEIKSPDSRTGLQFVSDRIVEKYCGSQTPVVAQRRDRMRPGGGDKTSLIEGGSTRSTDGQRKGKRQRWGGFDLGITDTHLAPEIKSVS